MSVNLLIDKGAFLAHYGTKGMQWGVHNDETKRKYGELQAAGGGGIGSDEDDDTVLDEVGKYNPNTEAGQENRKQLEEHLTNKGIRDAKALLNKHLLDIQKGNISQGEARVIGLINAASKAITGEGVISNPKAEKEGVKYGQDKKKPVFIK